MLANIRMVLVGTTHPGNIGDRARALPIQRMLIDIDFLKPDNPQHVMRRLRRLFNRSQLEKTERNILRGILTNVQKTIG